jgi:uncharacterized protein (TIGR00369 family)
MSNRLDGYSTDATFDPAEDHIGPFYFKKADDRWRFAFVAETKHCNAFNMIHGGVLMTFADFCLCIEATNHYIEETCVTVSFNCEFVAAGKKGDLIESTTELVRKTRTMAFVRGTVSSADQALLSYSAVVKLLKKEV